MNLCITLRARLKPPKFCPLSHEKHNSAHVFSRYCMITVENIGQSADFSFAALIVRLSPDLAIIA